MTYNRVLFTVTALMITSTPGAAAPGQRLRSACADADAVIVGIADPVAADSSPALLAVAVEDVVKGALRANTSLTVTWPGSLTSVRVAPRRYRALWFLKNDAGRWEIMPIGGRNAPHFASGLSVPASAAAASQSSSGECYERIWALLKDNSAYIDQEFPALIAMETLLQEDPAMLAATNPAYSIVVNSYAQSQSINLRALAIASGLRRGDIASLNQLAAEVASIARSRTALNPAFAVASWRDADPAALAALGTIAGRAGAADALTFGAADALMMIHTREAVPHLVKLLLLSDPQLANRAVRGLSLFVNGAPILSGNNIRNMAFLTEGQSREFLDEGIAPYVTISPVPPDRQGEYTGAWLAWWARMGANWK